MWQSKRSSWTQFLISHGFLICLAIHVLLCDGLNNCPHMENCECLGAAVKCVNIESEMPTGLPKNITKMMLINLNLPSLPTDYFNQFKHLMQLYIKSANIRIIKSCTFQGLNIQSFTLRESVIDEIESYAFSNLHNVSGFSFYKSKIHKIHEYAFYNFENITRFDLQQIFVSTELPTHALFSLHNVRNLEIRDSIFSSINTLALNEITGIKMNIQNNTFTTIGCQNNDSLAVVFDQVDISVNKMWCDCALSWLIKIPINQRWSLLKYLNLMVENTTVGNNLCLGPQMLLNYTLGRLTFEQLNCPQHEIAKSQDCQSLRNLDIDPPFSTCEGMSSITYNRLNRMKRPPNLFTEWKNNKANNNHNDTFLIISLLFLAIFIY